MSNVHNVYNATIERRSERLPLCRGLDVAGRNHLVARFQILGAIIHPTAPHPSISHLWINRIIGQANRQLPDVT